jgi:hypothetical protein
VIEALGHVWVFRSQDLLPDGQCAAKQLLGSPGHGSRNQKHTKIIGHCSDGQLVAAIAFSMFHECFRVWPEQ